MTQRYPIVAILRDGSDGPVIGHATADTAAEAERSYARYVAGENRTEPRTWRAVLPGVPVASALEHRDVDTALAVDASTAGSKALHDPTFIFHVPATWIADEMRRVAVDAWNAGRLYGGKEN